MRPPRWVLASASALLVWQVASVVSLPIVLVHAQSVAAAKVAYCVRPADGCSPDGQCLPSPPSRPAEGDPCRLVCVSDHGVSTWFGIAAPRLDVERLPDPSASAVRHERLFLTRFPAYPPATPPPEA
jgi:hypothetical protein